MKITRLKIIQYNFFLFYFKLIFIIVNLPKHCEYEAVGEQHEHGNTTPMVVTQAN